MALWSITTPTTLNNVKCSGKNELISLAECVPVMEPIFKFSNLLLEPHVLATHDGERVRSLAYNPNKYVSSELSSRQFHNKINESRSWLHYKLITQEQTYTCGMQSLLRRYF